MSWTVVIPHAAKSSRATRIPASRSSALSSGRSARDIAFSCSNPVASPFSSRTMHPPAGSGVSSVIPMRSSAAVLTRAMCAHVRLRNTE